MGRWMGVPEINSGLLPSCLRLRLAHTDGSMQYIDGGLRSQRSRGARGAETVGQWIGIIIIHRWIDNISIISIISIRHIILVRGTRPADSLM